MSSTASLSSSTARAVVSDQPKARAADGDRAVLPEGAALAGGVEGGNAESRRPRLTPVLTDDARHQVCHSRLAAARQRVLVAERPMQVTGSLCRPCAATSARNPSAKIRRGQEASSQKQPRAASPCQGQSATVRMERLWMRVAAVAHTGQGGAVRVDISVISTTPIEAAAMDTTTTVSCAGTVAVMSLPTALLPVLSGGGPQSTQTGRHHKLRRANMAHTYGRLGSLLGMLALPVAGTCGCERPRRSACSPWPGTSAGVFPRSTSGTEDPCNQALRGGGHEGRGVLRDGRTGGIPV